MNNLEDKLQRFQGGATNEDIFADHKPVLKFFNNLPEWCQPSRFPPKTGRNGRSQKLPDLSIYRSSYNRLYWREYLAIFGTSSCMICHERFPILYKGSKKQRVDFCLEHDHGYGLKVRGIVCRSCNFFIAYIDKHGYWDKWRQFLNNAHEYMRQGEIAYAKIQKHCDQRNEGFGFVVTKGVNDYLTTNILG